MPQPPTQDLSTTVDFTTQSVLSGTILNTALQNLTGSTSSSGSVAFCLITTDTAVGVPEVPDAGATPKWANYGWIRVPNSADSTSLPTLYIWNPSIMSGPLLRWQSTQVSLTATQASITALQTQVTAAQTTATTAQTTANAATTAANNATTIAGTANTNAATALTNANAAQTAATAAQATATAAQTTANAANTNANTAIATVNSLVGSRFRTALFPLLAGSQPVLVAHGLSAIPSIKSGVMVCIAPGGDSGFSQNDEVPIEAFECFGGGGSAESAFTLGVSSTNVWITQNSISTNGGPASIQTNNKTTGLLTVINWNNWNLKAYCQL